MDNAQVGRHEFYGEIGAAGAGCEFVAVCGAGSAGGSAREAQELCGRVIESTQDFAAAFKVNSAFFEVFGGEGMNALRDVIALVPHAIPVILDAEARGYCGHERSVCACGVPNIGRGGNHGEPVSWGRRGGAVSAGCGTRRVCIDQDLESGGG